jgi:hypothetical protein
MPLFILKGMRNFFIKFITILCKAVEGIIKANKMQGHIMYFNFGSSTYTYSKSSDLKFPITTFKVNFLCQNLSECFSIFFFSEFSTLMMSSKW